MLGIKNGLKVNSWGGKLSKFSTPIIDFKYLHKKTAKF